VAPVPIHTQPTCRKNQGLRFSWQFLCRLIDPNRTRLMLDGKADSLKRNAATWFAVAAFHPLRLKFSKVRDGGVRKCSRLALFR
jgi:hypothetical protein